MTTLLKPLKIFPSVYHPKGLDVLDDQNLTYMHYKYTLSCRDAHTHTTVYHLHQHFPLISHTGVYQCTDQTFDAFRTEIKRMQGVKFCWYNATMMLIWLNVRKFDFSFPFVLSFVFHGQTSMWLCWRGWSRNRWDSTNPILTTGATWNVILFTSSTGLKVLWNFSWSGYVDSISVNPHQDKPIILVK